MQTWELRLGEVGACRSDAPTSEPAGSPAARPTLSLPALGASPLLCARSASLTHQRLEVVVAGSETSQYVSLGWLDLSRRPPSLG